MRKKETFQKILHKRLDLQRSDIVPYDQRILDLINKLGAKDPANRPTAQKALDEALAIDEDIKAEHAEELLERNVQAIVNRQNARRANAIRVSALVANYFLENARKRTIARLVIKLKKSLRFKNIQLEERWRDLTLASERERQENERLKQEMLREKALIEEKEREGKARLQQEKTLTESEREKIQAEFKRQLAEQKAHFDAQEVERRKQEEEREAEMRKQQQDRRFEFERMLEIQNRMFLETTHRQLVDTRVQTGILRPRFKEMKRKHVICFQSLFRKKNAMNCFKTKKRSAITIQSWLRKESAASKYKKYLSAKKIQSVVRKVQAGKGYKKCKDAVIRLQYFIRTRQIRLQYFIRTRQCNLKDKQKLSNVHYDKFVIKASEARHAREENAMLHNQNNARVLEMEHVRAENAELVSNIEGMQKDLICPITLHRFVDPVVARDGFVYERSAIQQCFDNNRMVSPMTNEPLNDTTLTPCKNVKTIARAFDDVTGNNNNVRILDAQLQVVRGEYQQRLEESVAIREQLTAAIAEKAGELVRQRALLTVKNGEITGYVAAVAEKAAQIDAKDREIAEKDDEINGYVAVVAEKDAKIDAKDREINGYVAVVAEKDAKIDAKDREIAEKDDEINGYVALVAEKDAEIDAHPDAIAEKDAEIENFQQQLANAKDTIELFRIQTKTYANGAVYVGQMKNGNRHGFGTYTGANGNVYVGEWKDNKQHGNGTYTWDDGRVYVGEYKDGNKHGNGTYTWDDGRVYVGEYKDGKKDGKGTYTLASGNVYVGEWKDDKIHGYGKYTRADGSIWHDGMWEDGKRVL